MIIYFILVLQRIILCKNPHAASQNEDISHLKNIIEGIEKIRNSVMTESQESIPFRIIITNRCQDLIDDISLAIPYVKKFFETHFKIIKDIFEKSMKEATEKKIKDIKEGTDKENSKNRKLLYKSIFLDFIKTFRTKYAYHCLRLKMLKTHEIINLNKIIIAANFSNSDYLERNAETKFKEIDEKPLYTKEEKIKIVEGSITDKVFNLNLIEEVCIFFLVIFDNLKTESSDYSVLNSEKNNEYLNAEFETNIFSKILKEIYSKNRWPLPIYYENLTFEGKHLLKNILYDFLCKFILEKYINENFMNIFKKKKFAYIIDCIGIHLPPFIPNTAENHIFPSDWQENGMKLLEKIFNNISCINFYLSFNLSIEDWLLILIKQLFYNLRKEDFLYILGKDFFKDEEKRKIFLDENCELISGYKPFSDDIKSFLEKLKNNIKSETYVAFYIYKVEDSVFRNMITDFFEETEISKHELLQGKDKEDEYIRIRKNVMIVFEIAFESTLNRYLSTDGLIKKKTLTWQE